MSVDPGDRVGENQGGLLMTLDASFPDNCVQSETAAPHSPPGPLPAPPLDRKLWGKVLVREAGSVTGASPGLRSAG